MEEKGVLEDHADVPAQRLEGYIPQVDTIEQDGALLWVVEARQQIGKAGLARSAWANERH